MNRPLKDILKITVSDMKNNTPYSIQDILERLEKYPQFNKKYKLMAIQKCIVNNPLRVSIGELGDLLYFKDLNYNRDNTLLYKYNPGIKDIPIYNFDKELSRKKAMEAKKSAEKRRTNFLSTYEYRKLTIPDSNNDIAIINTCSSSKLETFETVRASQLYIGREFNIINRLKDNNNFDHYIISAKYGLINSEEWIENYNKTFLGLTLHDIEAISNELGIRKNLEYLINTKRYKIIFLVLGNHYMRTLQLKTSLESDIPIITFLLDKNNESHQILKGKNIYNIKLETSKMIKRFENYGAIDLKIGIIEQLFKRYPNQDFKNKPELIKSFMREPKKKNSLF